MHPCLYPGAAVPSSSATLPVCPTLVQITSGYCPKTWEVSNTLTKTSIGNFCATPRYSSKYSCAANCVYTSQKLRQAQCAGLPDRLSYFQGGPQPLQPVIWPQQAKCAGLLDNLLLSKLLQVTLSFPACGHQWSHLCRMSCLAAGVARRELTCGYT